MHICTQINEKYVCSTYSYGFHAKLLHIQIDKGLTGLYTLSPSLSLVQAFVGVVDRYTFAYVHSLLMLCVFAFCYIATHLS